MIAGQLKGLETAGRGNLNERGADAAFFNVTHGGEVAGDLAEMAFDDRAVGVCNQIKLPAMGTKAVARHHSRYNCINDVRQDQGTAYH